jgi:hypothetical protein
VKIQVGDLVANAHHASDSQYYTGLGLAVEWYDSVNDVMYVVWLDPYVDDNPIHASRLTVIARPEQHNAGKS